MSERDATNLPSRSRLGPEPPETPEHAARSTKRWFTFLGAWMADIVTLDVALNFPRSSLAYQWTNRIAIFIGLILLFGGGIVGLCLIRQWHESRKIAWVGRGAVVLAPLIFIVKLWVRILDAFWLR